jgi:hypothetical protein
MSRRCLALSGLLINVCLSFRQTTNVPSTHELQPGDQSHQRKVELSGVSESSAHMIESIMYMGIGLLIGCLLALAIVPFVHNRGVRLTARRLESPSQSMAEIQADKDLLRAEFAMSMRRFEITVEQLKNKLTNQLVELGKKSEIINRLNLERNELKAEVMNLRRKVPPPRASARDRGNRGRLDAQKKDPPKTSPLPSAEQSVQELAENY